LTLALAVWEMVTVKQYTVIGSVAHHMPGTLIRNNVMLNRFDQDPTISTTTWTQTFKIFFLHIYIVRMQKIVSIFIKKKLKIFHGIAQILLHILITHLSECIRLKSGISCRKKTPSSKPVTRMCVCLWNAVAVILAYPAPSPRAALYVCLQWYRS